jgi:hypothetical protein
MEDQVSEASDHSEMRTFRVLPYHNTELFFPCNRVDLMLHRGNRCSNSICKLGSQRGSSEPQEWFGAIEEGRMENEILSLVFTRLLSDLAELQRRCERKFTTPKEHGREMWARGVLFGIETGRARIVENGGRSLDELQALLSDWEGIRAHAETSPEEQSLRGLDFGIRLVIGRVRSFLSAGLEETPARPKPPTSADTGEARSGHKRRPTSGA